MISDAMLDFLARGGPAIWSILVLSVVALGVFLWKVAGLFAARAWSRRRVEIAVRLWEIGEADNARAELRGRPGIRARVLRSAFDALSSGMDEARAREEATRVARLALADLGAGSRVLELTVTIAPLLGLLGTVFGMIEAFQVLEEAGSRADPAALAGGIWEALLTTAAGMAVAIPASVALSWIEGQLARVALDLESLVTRAFVAGRQR